MKLTIFIITIAFIQVSAAGYAQKISLSERNTAISNILTKIQEQSGYDIFYKNKLVKDSKISLQLKEVSLEDALKAVLADQDLEFSIEDKLITIRQKVPSFLDKISNAIGNLHKDIDVRGRIIGEKDQVLVGAVVRVKGTDKATRTNQNGEFYLAGVDEKATLVISFLGYEVKEVDVKADLGTIIMTMTIGKLDEVNVVSTGYQQLSKENVTGSFDQIDNELINRKVSTNILDRLDGVSSGVYFNPTANKSINTAGISFRNSGINIRGQSTINASVDPLIILDNFPYEGEVNNINPNDIESITILKDAASASIWGANAGNGVIVITTKKGRLNEKMKVDFSSNITIANKPNLYYDKNFLNSSDYIDVETNLFNQGYFNSDLNNTSSHPAISPAVEILANQRNGTISQDMANTQLNALRKIDVRDDFDKNIYQKSIDQQYSIGIRGGTKNLTYALSVGYDDNKDNLILNGYNRTTINSQNTYSPFKNLEITTGINYSQSTTQLDNQFDYGNGSSFTMNSKYSALYPYAQFADAAGNPLSINKNFRNTYISDMESKGFLDWNYRPLDEIVNADNTTKINDLLLRVGLKYKIITGLNAEVQYQNERQIIDANNLQNQNTYYTRNLINKFSNYDSSTGTITNVFPVGDILNTGSYNWQSYNLRGQLNYNQIFGKNAISAIAGAEMRERTTNGSIQNFYGYNDEFGTANGSLNFNTSYPVNPSGSAYLPNLQTGITEGIYRYISYFSNIAYTYDNRYTFTLSGRKDGANIFGAKTNDKVTPLWSTGLGWHINNEGFYGIDWLPYLRLRASYGFNGNVYPGSAYLTGNYSIRGLANLPTINITRAPNPELRWEKVRNINIGLDFSTKNNRLSGTVEIYRKDGLDLLEPTPLAPQTGFTTYFANTANTRSFGSDITLQSKNLTGAISWTSTLLLSMQHDKVTKYEAPQTSSSIQNLGLSGNVGKPLYGIFSYKWAGLDPATGSPRGYLNGAVSEDYYDIIDNYKGDSVVYSGSARPTVFGSFRNDFFYKGFSFSFNIKYEFGFVFRRPSISTNYTDIIKNGGNSDYDNRWQKPGDELHTNVPALIYPSDSYMNQFYTYSQVLIQSGDNIRLQDLRLGYDIPKRLFKKNSLQHLQAFAYANNVGILWRKNKFGIDPDVVDFGAVHTLPNSFSISFGINANF